MIKEKPTIENEVSDETGEFDPRFMLWRKFCDEHGVPVESLPGDLTGDLKREWEKFKDAGFRQPVGLQDSSEG